MCFEPMKTQHTPGPWKCDKSGDGKWWTIGRGQSTWGTHVAEVHRDDIDREEAEANCRLILLAPELLEEAKQSLFSLELALESHGYLTTREHERVARLKRLISNMETP